jgi:hypothetical protein
MILKLAFYVLLTVVGLLLFVPLFLRVVNHKAYYQAKDQVVIREPGRRLLGEPQPVASEARKDIEFAWLSQAAYQRAPDQPLNSASGCSGPDLALHNTGWVKWKRFPDGDPQKRIDSYHLRVEVWANRAQGAVAVAFGGTEATNRRDWRANLRWFIPFRNDEYTETVKEFGPAFVRQYLRLKQQPEWAFLKDATIFSTGHSLGGGLAQEFAYSLPTNPEVPRVTKVYAFDPSPVTGFYSLDRKTRCLNSKYLAIDRIYERGEVLAIARSFINFFYPPSAKEPVIRQIRYNLFSRAPISGHSISDLACKLDEAMRPSRLPAD